MTDIKNDKHEQAKIFADNMKKQRDVAWLEQRLIEISGRPGYEAEEDEIKKQLRSFRSWQ